MERKTLKPTRRENKETSLPARFSPRFWSHCDSRLAVVKSIRSRLKILREACGGDESPQRDLLIQRIVFLAVIIETAEVRAAEGGSLDMGSYVQALNSFVGLLRAVGLERRIKSAKGLTEYLEEKAG